MLQFARLSVVAPTLVEGVEHVRACLDLDVPFRQRHSYTGTHNYLLQLGDLTYLEIIALDLEVERPAHARWFGLDDLQHVQCDWEVGHRLWSWGAYHVDIEASL